MAEPITLSEDEREIVELELRALLPALSDERRASYEALREAVASGDVPADHVGELESVVVLALQTARARTLYRAEGETILTGLFRRTPRGKELSQQLADVNAALRALNGKEVTGVTVRMRTLGHFTIAIDTEGANLTLAVRADGVRLESVSAGAA